MLLRLSIHLYQGWVALPSVLSFGLVAGLYYSRERQLWPPFLAHVLHDVIAVLLLH
jgi:membrane protease YdiL (CAAX protease family)